MHAAVTPLLKPAEAAEVLGVCEKTLQQCRARGLRYVTVTRGAIRYRADDLEAYIEANTCRSEPPKPKSGNTTSRSGVVDFAEALAQTTMKRRRR
ncbi:helix-turn-helix domain-containing protein [Marinovum algicola]|uniref:helix-turn-helix domain-containing protein n=1 Tax=Marinovum algicola TaxID=42444 RepID=UPI003B52A626